MESSETSAKLEQPLKTATPCHEYCQMRAACAPEVAIRSGHDIRQGFHKEASQWGLCVNKRKTSDHELSKSEDRI